LLVMGDADLAGNENLSAFFNREFLLNAVQWLVGDEQLIAERPKGLRPSRLDMTQEDFSTLFRLGVVVLLIAAVCLVVWVDRPKPEDAAKPAEQGALLSFDAADVRRIEIDRSSGTVALERVGENGWSLVAPRRVEADPARVDEMLRSLHDARAVAVVEEKGGDESRFGLATPELAVRLTLAREPAARTLRIGRKSPVGLERYAATGDGRILLADASLASALERSPDELEEKRLLPVAAEDVRRILVKRPGGNLGLRKDGSEWSLTEPMRDTADASAADALARSLASLSVTKRLAPDEANRAGAPSIEI